MASLKVSSLHVLLLLNFHEFPKMLIFFFISTSEVLNVLTMDVYLKLCFEQQIKCICCSKYIKRTSLGKKVNIILFFIVCFVTSLKFFYILRLQIQCSLWHKRPARYLSQMLVTYVCWYCNFSKPFFPFFLFFFFDKYIKE